MSLSFCYEVLTKASPSQAWEIFSNWRRWHTFANIYGSMEWSGTPWTEGSRLRIEVLQPVQMWVDHVITFCEPARRVGWIDHGAGVTIEQWIHFEPAHGGTRVSTNGEIVGGESVRVAGKRVEALIQEFTRTWYENFRLVCNELAGVQA